MKHLIHKLTLATVLLLGWVVTAHAQLRVEISGVGAQQIPVAIAVFENEFIAPQTMSAIIKADLTRSGIFKIVGTSDILSDTAQVDFAAWKQKGADAIAIGSVHAAGDGRFDIRYRLMDTVRSVQLSGFSIKSPAASLRMSAHKIADDIYEKLTGIKGIFSTKIAYIVRNNTSSGREYRLEVADSDGENSQSILRSREPIISPVWSPDGTKIAYVSFENQKPVVYSQNIVTRQRIVVANFKGSNSAPAWSPDGTRIALALTRDGLSQVYVVSADGAGNPRRITNTFGIDTEPRFAPDGQSLYFTSDRSGGPQVYQVNLNNTSDIKRVTYSGSYNISPRVSPDGKTLAYVSRRDGKFQVFAMDLTNGQELRLSDNAADEAPSFAPNGKYIMFATEYGRRGTLAVSSVDGQVKQRLTTQAGDIREPSWGPFTQ